MVLFADNAGCVPPEPLQAAQQTLNTFLPATPYAHSPVQVTPYTTTSNEFDTDVQPPTTPPITDDRSRLQGSPQAPPSVTPFLPKKISRTEIGHLLGWVDAPASNLICHGYYVEPNLYYPAVIDQKSKKAPLTILADQSLLSQTDTSKLAGHVMISQPDRRIDSDLAYINRNPETLKADSIDVYGQVVLREPGSIAIGNQGHFDLLDKSGTLSDVLYRMTYGKGFTSDKNKAEDAPLQNTQTNSWGMADSVHRDASGIITIKKGTYSACPPLTNVWHIMANTLTLDHETGRGEAYNALLYLGDMPVLYSPYFSFPIDNRRKTGFLYPTFGHSTNTGYELGTPFYWNIAPDKDATITPDIMTDRGVQLNAIFRYLSSDSSGNIHGSFLPDDKMFSQFQSDALTTYPPDTAGLKDLENDSDNRYFISLQDTRQYDANWSSYLYLNHVSDDYYFEDFNSDPAQITDNQILNQADLYYNSDHWHFTGQGGGYQTLHPINQIYVANQYQELPELILNGNYPNFADNFSFNLNNQYDNFAIVEDPVVGTQPEGSRFYVSPDLNYNKQWMWGFFKPDFQLSTTEYQLTHQIPGEDTEISRVIPITDIDAGLFFDRNIHFFSQDYQQTLEPRLFYLYVPYHDQNDIPLFDTTVEPFSFSQLFETNRFTGIDRIGDTNQISMALTSRFINEETGDQKLKASVGEIYYFDDRKVFINNDDLDLLTLDNQVPLDNKISPVAAELDYFINKQWQVTTNMAWDPIADQTNNANLMLQYRKDNQHIMNVGYTFLRGGDAFTPPNGETVPTNSSKNNLNQTDLSVVWPLVKNWTVLARWNYNVSHNYPQTYFAGLQYDACCWSFRTVVGREFNYLDNYDKPQFNNQVYFQIALKTLGSVGTSDPASVLNNIPGYIDTFGQV